MSRQCVTGVGIVSSKIGGWLASNSQVIGCAPALYVQRFAGGPSRSTGMYSETSGQSATTRPSDAHNLRIGAARSEQLPHQRVLETDTRSVSGFGSDPRISKSGWSVAST